MRGGGAGWERSIGEPIINLLVHSFNSLYCTVCILYSVHCTPLRKITCTMHITPHGFKESIVGRQRISTREIR